MSDTRLHRLDRWFYRGGRPNRVARLLNRVWAAVSATGLAGPDRLVALEVRGRTTGRTITLPLVVADHGGERYLVPMLGAGAGWVRNVRAADGHAVVRHGRRERVRLVEIPPGERPPVLRRYLEVAPGARAHMPVDRDAPEAEFAAIADRYPVFRIVAER